MGVDILARAMASGKGGGASDLAIKVDSATDEISLTKSGEPIPDSGATLPKYSLEYDTATGGLTLTKDGQGVQGGTVALTPYGSPLKAAVAADMTDTDKVYVYTGSESGYENGHWYYYDSDATPPAWTDGGVYNAVSVVTDKTLTVEDVPADAKATGEAIDDLKTQIEDLTGNTIYYAKDNGYYKLNNSTVDPTDIGASGPYKHTVISCNPGDIFTITGSSAGNVARLYAFTDSNYNVKGDVPGIGYSANNEIITAPEDAAWLFVNDHQDTLMLYSGLKIILEVDNLEQSIDDLKESTDRLASLTTQETENGVSDMGKGKWEISGTVASYVSAESGADFALNPVPVSENDVVRIYFRPASGDSVIFAKFENSAYTVINSISFGQEHELYDAIFTIAPGVTHVLMTKYGSGRVPYCNKIEQKTDKTLLDATIINREINKVNDATIINCYMRMADGQIVTTSAGVSTLYFACSPETLYRIDHKLSGRFIVGCFADLPAENSTPTKFVIGTSANKNEDTTFIRTDSTAKYLAAYFYSSTYELDTYENTYAAIKIYANPVDNTLTQSGVPADAKTIGDKFKAAHGGFYVADDDIPPVNTFSGVIDLYDDLVTEHGDYVTKNTLTKGGVTLYEYVFTSGNYNSKTGERAQDDEIAKPVVLIESGIHGDEKASVMSLYGFCKKLCENDYNLTDIINFVTLKVIPIVNPSGYNANTRLNSNGVNLNRNFDSSNWEQTDPGQNYSGAAPADQYETQIIQEWLDANTNALVFIDWHNSGFVGEISCLLGNTDADTMDFKKQYLYGINKIIPYWQIGREIPDTSIYAYTGHTQTTGTAKSYGDNLNIISFTFETSWNVNNKGQNGPFSIGTGEEAIVYLLTGFNKYFKNI